MDVCVQSLHIQLFLFPLIISPSVTMLAPLFSTDNRAFTHNKNRLVYPAAIMTKSFACLAKKSHKKLDELFFARFLWLLQWRFALISIAHFFLNKEEITTPQKVPTLKEISPAHTNRLHFQGTTKQNRFLFTVKTCV